MDGNQRMIKWFVRAFVVSLMVVPTTAMAVQTGDYGWENNPTEPILGEYPDGYMNESVVASPTYDGSDFSLQLEDNHPSGTPQAYVPILTAMRGRRFQCIQIKHQGRVVARNVGMKAAKGEWITWLDSDDAYDAEYLNTFSHNIQHNPDASLWVCGVVMHGMVKDDKQHICPKWTKLRHAWTPPLNEEGDYPVHAHFPSGRVGTGMFVFKRECLEKTGVMPDWGNHNQVADGCDEWLGYETGYSSAKRLVGNPWGDDHVFFRKLCMFYRVHIIEACLYIHYVR